MDSQISTFKIKAYGWQEFAHKYNPHILPRSASKRLKEWIRRNKKLHNELKALGWNEKNRLLTPIQVKAIVHYLGEPGW
ncbi:MAG: DUF4248 domain-containing protein [Tannerellaceae bacterium]|nr:DUF4248 domain-containing protein [Tannerellaceae bacterium]MCD8177788.1 DUF4248 domain-containing protein [Tannerellaceae bacterium]